ncbi:host-nuclease inhibitor Gam family protein [bacterium]|nr:host-nuclease inhibitor Gam family protein [bacterium]
MAKTVKAVSIKTWDDVTTVVAEMSHICEDRAVIAAKYEPELRRLQAEQAEQLAPLDARYDELESKVQEFALSHLADFGKKKSIEFPYGTVSVRKTESVCYTGEDQEAGKKKAAEKLRELGLKDCFKETLKPVAAALKRLSQDVLDLAGVVISESISVTVKPLGKN